MNNQLAGVALIVLGAALITLKTLLLFLEVDMLGLFKKKFVSGTAQVVVESPVTGDPTLAALIAARAARGQKERNDYQREQRRKLHAYYMEKYSQEIECALYLTNHLGWPASTKEDQRAHYFPPCERYLIGGSGMEEKDIAAIAAIRGVSADALTQRGEYAPADERRAKRLNDMAGAYRQSSSGPCTSNVPKRGVPSITKEQWEEAQRVYYADKKQQTYKGQRKAGWMAGAGVVKP